MKKYFIYLLLLVSLLLVTSCNVNKPTDVTEPLENFETQIVTRLSKNLNRPNNKTNNIIDKADRLVFSDFGYTFTKLLLDGEHNQIFSPVSLYFCLAMLYVGTTDEEIKAEIENLMQIESEEHLLAMLKSVSEDNYYCNQYGRAYLANSIWISNSYKVREAYVEKLQNNFQAESYHIDFTNYDARQEIINWINHYTENLLELNQEKFPISENNSVLLVNTLYFNNKWEKEAKDEGNKLFYLVNGKTVETSYFAHKNFTTLYKDNKQYTVVQDYLENDNKITFIMPHSGNVNDVIKLDYQTFFKDLASERIDLSIPSFSAYSKYDLEGAFYYNNCGTLFTKADGFKKISDDLRISLIRQDAGIKLTKDGVEAAAVTVIGEKGVAIPMVSITLDHPFMYIISDHNDIPLFVGTIINPTC